jgi:outer membrane protein TolC
MRFKVNNALILVAPRAVTAACVAAACAALSGGCMSSGVIRADIQHDRARAFEAWQAERAAVDEPVPLDRLTVADAVQTALLYNQTLQSAVLEKEVARGQVVSALVVVAPTVSAGSTLSDGTDDARHVLDVTARQPLFRAGGATAALRAARLQSYLAEEGVNRQVQATIGQTMADYYDMLLAQKLHEVNEAAVASAEAQLAEANKKFGNGVASQYDVLRAEVEVSNFRAAAIKQKNNLVMARTRLLRTMGAAPDAAVTPADALTRVPTQASLETALRTAYLRRPELRQAEARIRMQRQSLAAIRSRYFPAIDLTASRRATHARDGDGTQSWLVGIETRWTLLDGFDREGDRIVERARLTQREIDLRNAEEGVFLDVQQALLALANADELIDSQARNLERAKEGSRLAQVGYTEGINTEVEVVDSRSALTQAQGLYYQALYDHNMARLALKRAMGTLGLDELRAEP